MGGAHYESHYWRHQQALRNLHASLQLRSVTDGGRQRHASILQQGQSGYRHYSWASYNSVGFRTGYQEAEQILKRRVCGSDRA